MTETVPVDVLLADREGRTWTSGAGLNVFTKPSDVNLSKVRRLLIVVASSKLALVADLVKAAQKVHKLVGLLVRTDVSTFDRVLIEFANADLRSLRNALVHSDSDAPRRVLNAWRHGAQDRLIATVAVDDGSLFVRDCALRSYVVPRSKVQPLRNLSDKGLRDFEVAPNGQYIHWTEGDIHLGLDALRAAVDPDEALRQVQQRVIYSEKLGRAIRQLRESHNLAQSDVPDLSPRELRRLEAGEHVPRVATLEKLAKAHSYSVADYLDRLAEVLRRL